MRALILLAAAAASAAAQSDDPHKVAGKFHSPILMDAYQGGAAIAPTKTSIKGMQQQLAAIAELMHATPAFASPVGFVVKPIVVAASASSPWESSRYKWPMPGALTLYVIGNWIDADTKKLNISGVTTKDGEARGVIQFHANSVDCLFKKTDMSMLTDSSWYYEPVKTGDDHGYPIYEHECTVITHRQAPVFTPVSRERVMSRLIVDAAAALKEIEPMEKVSTSEGTREAVRRARANVARLRGVLAAMSPADRKAPAYLKLGADNSPFGERGEPLVFPIVERNPELFDRTRPGDIQLLTILMQPCEQCTFEQTQVKAARAQLDWAALAKIVK
jgi:hypothetical protein